MDVYAKAGVPRHKLVVIPESVDAEFFHPLVQPVSKSRDRFVFFSNFKWEFRKGCVLWLGRQPMKLRCVPWVAPSHAIAVAQWFRISTCEVLRFE